MKKDFITLDQMNKRRRGIKEENSIYDFMDFFCPSHLTSSSFFRHVGSFYVKCRRLCQNLESYLVPVAVSSVAGLRAHVCAHHRWRWCGDGDVWHGGWSCCRHSNSRAVVAFAQLLRVLVPKSHIFIN